MDKDTEQQLAINLELRTELAKRATTSNNTEVGFKTITHKWQTDLGEIQGAINSGKTLQEIQTAVNSKMSDLATSIGAARKLGLSMLVAFINDPPDNGESVASVNQTEPVQPSEIRILLPERDTEPSEKALAKVTTAPSPSAITPSGEDKTALAKPG